MLKPVIATPGAWGRTRTFWLLFAVLDAIAAVGLVLFSRAFGEDTADTRRRARGVMVGVYTLILLVATWFCYVAFSAAPVQYRTTVQAIIFLALGVGGLTLNWRRIP